MGGAGGSDGYDLSMTGDVLWSLTDQLGTVRDLAVYDNGVTSIANHRVYDSFGNLKSQTNSAVDCLFGFTGRALDNATGLQNNWHRWYDGKVGRWVSKDPISFTGGDANTSRYVGNQPTDLRDPSGLARAKIAKYILDLIVKVEKETAEFIVKGGKHIKIRNAQFFNSSVSLLDLDLFTQVAKDTLKNIEKKYPGISIYYDALAQPQFVGECVKGMVTGIDFNKPGYAKLAWAKLKETMSKTPEGLREYLAIEGKYDEYVWHHNLNGTLQLVDREVHTAFQHTGAYSIVRGSTFYSVIGAFVAALPGVEEFNVADYNGAFRSVSISFTPLSLGEFITYPLCAYYEECERQIGEYKNVDKTGLSPATREALNAIRAWTRVQTRRVSGDSHTDQQIQNRSYMAVEQCLA